MAASAFSELQLPAETRAALALARRTLQPEHVQVVQELNTRALDHAPFLDLVHFHGLSPLLYRHTCEHPELGLPASAIAQLWAGWQLNARRNERMSLELFRILDAFENAGIRPICYKGPALAVAALGDLTLREFVDLDVLVPPTDVPAACRILQQMGYRSRAAVDESLLPEFIAHRRQYDLEFIDAERNILVELHWRTSARFPVEGTGDWQCGAWEIPLLGRTVRTLAPTQLLLALLLHGAKHRWVRLASLADVAELVRMSPAIDWASIASTSERLGCHRRVGTGLLLAGRLLGAPVPAQLLAELERDTVAIELSASIARGIVTRAAKVGVWQDLRYEFMISDSAWQALRYAADLVLEPNSKDWREDSDRSRSASSRLAKRAWRLASKHLR
jgi:hypothetical protein